MEGPYSRKKKFSVAEYRARLVTAEHTLQGIARQERELEGMIDNERVKHLDAKAEGVRLALSYLDEMNRG